MTYKNFEEKIIVPPDSSECPSPLPFDFAGCCRIAILLIYNDVVDFEYY